MTVGRGGAFPARRRLARRRTALPVTGIVIGAGLAGFAGTKLATASPAPRIDAGTVPASQPIALPAPVPTHTPSGSLPVPATPPPALVVGAPQRLQLPASGVDAAIVPVRVDPGGKLGVPGDVTRLGWWSTGPLPGAPVGTVVIDGHVDDRAGPGALFRLARTPVGSPLMLRTTGGVLRYAVRARRLYGKDQLPVDLFTTGSRPRLVLITCGGPFDAATGHYRDNVVLYAVPVPASP